MLPNTDDEENRSEAVTITTLTNRMFVLLVFLASNSIYPAGLMPLVELVGEGRFPAGTTKLEDARIVISGHQQAEHTTTCKSTIL